MSVVKLKIKGEFYVIKLEQEENCMDNLINKVNTIPGDTNYCDGIFLGNGRQLITDYSLWNCPKSTILMVNSEEMLWDDSFGCDARGEEQDILFLPEEDHEHERVEEVVPDTIVIYQEILKKFELNLDDLKVSTKNKIINGAILNGTEKDELLRIFAKDILKIDPFISCDKVSVLCMQLALEIPCLIERDEDGNVRGNGCTKMSYSLEGKIEYLRRKNPMTSLATNLRQFPKANFKAIDNAFKEDKEYFEKTMQNVNNMTDREFIKTLLKKTWHYQRAEICSVQRKDPLNAYDEISQRWHILQEPDLALFNLTMFGCSCIKQHLQNKLAEMTQLCGKLGKIKCKEPHKILVILTNYFHEKLEFIFLPLF